MLTFDGESFYTIEELTEKFGVNRSYISRQVNKEHKLQACKIGKSLYFGETDIRAWLKNNRVNSMEDPEEQGATEEQEVKKKVAPNSEIEKAKTNNRVNRGYLLVNMQDIQEVKSYIADKTDTFILDNIDYFVDNATDEAKDIIADYLNKLKDLLTAA